MKMEFWKRHIWDLGTALVFVFLSIYCVFGYDDFGSSWDEQVRADQGELKLEYYEGLLKGEDQEVKPDSYPGFYDLNLAILRRVIPMKAETLGHLWTGFFGWIGLIAAWRLARNLGGARSGVVTLLFLVSLPRFMGHMFINPKDMPFAAMMMVGLGVLVDGARYWPRMPMKKLLLLGGCLGLAAATRIGGVLFWCYAVALVAALFSIDWIRQGSKLNGGEWLRAVVKLGIAYVVGALLLMLYWPYSHADFLERSTGALNTVTHFEWDMPVLFGGAYIPSAELPSWYLLTMFLLTTPVLHLLIGIVSAFGFWGILRREWIKQDYTQFLKYGLILGASIFPLAYVYIRHANVYNGIRHLLFIVPVVGVLVGLGFNYWWEKLGERAVTKKWIFIFVLGFAGVIGVRSIQKLHPYAYIYYNEILGGVKNADGAYELDYWATAYREAGEALIAFLDKDPLVKGKVIKIEMLHPRWLMAPYLDVKDKAYQIELTRGEGEASDFYVAATVWEADRYYGGQVVAAVRADGVLLAVVKDRRKLVGAERGFVDGIE